MMAAEEAGPGVAEAMLDFGGTLEAEWVVEVGGWAAGVASAMMDFGVGRVVGVGRLGGRLGLDSSCLVVGLDLGWDSG